MYTLKSIARRGLPLSAAIALLTGTIGAAVVPAMSAYADQLNPLTKRSLTLSSSSPGWDYKDGSGNSTYAPPNSGANGQKTGQTFSFNTSTGGTTLKAFTFQYCTGAAGDCISPGNDTSEPGGTDDATHSDLNVQIGNGTTTTAPSEVSQATYTAIHDQTAGARGVTTNVAAGEYPGLPKMDGSEGNFVVLDNSGAVSTGWSMAVSNVETNAGAGGTKTGKMNYITLSNSSSTLIPAVDDNLKVIFYGNNDNYITNPGAGAFFVKINDYSDATATTVVDGGVTVANVMNQSIELQTKVLETMAFSVGTVDPDTLDSTGGATGGGGSGSPLYLANGNTKHGICDRVLTGMTPSSQGTPNILLLGNQAQENSLETDHTYSTHSYWRLSSNSSAGATVYYSGATLSDTEGDQIKAIGPAKAAPLPGEEQFGLALDNGTSGNYAVDYAAENAAVSGAQGGLFENSEDGSPAGVNASVATDVASNPSYHDPKLAPLTPTTDYADGTGTINLNYGTASDPISTEFAFDPNSETVPVSIASESSQVVDCVTGKMRYIANIAATTPAGIYTTKVNYIAAPQY